MSGRDSSSKAKVKQQLRLRSAPFDLQRKVDDFAPISRMVLTVIVVDYRVYSSNIFICGEIKNICEYRSFGKNVLRKIVVIFYRVEMCRLVNVIVTSVDVIDSEMLPAL